jgi:hypothetical protein
MRRHKSPTQDLPLVDRGRLELMYTVWAIDAFVDLEPIWVARFASRPMSHLAYGRGDQRLAPPARRHEGVGR